MNARRGRHAELNGGQEGEEDGRGERKSEEKREIRPREKKSKQEGEQPDALSILHAEERRGMDVAIGERGVIT
jgi:hypothetical protein